MNLLIDFLHCEEYALKCKADQNCFSAQTLFCKALRMNDVTTTPSPGSVLRLFCQALRINDVTTTPSPGSVLSLFCQALRMK
jgi:hypothetical protein